ncbi:hypothetical protein JL193_10260 [Polaribacter batillariae]|uniref:Outer membrane protein beta-barrel domain-containing protein n=1 Tax=Polaribacter batillariae TaxID=2808900 RepID=A0ABX7SSL8_9FLAO|nr:hypothetical protein [Polaribacter batillariae]QTD36531.1 hypothetical protein JL193_10260 [Polaribacter batillariae]
MENKNIDRLFQERLKSLEATPNKKVWNNIESKLTKKKRSVLPFWWFSGAIAALFILGLFLFPFSNRNSTEDKNIIITNTTTEKIKENTKNTDSVILNKKIKNNVLIANEKPTKNSNIVKKKQTKKSNSNKVLITNNNAKSKGKKKLVSPQSAMEKIFLADNSAEENLVKKQPKKKVSNTKDSTFVDKKNKKLKPKKDFLATIKKNEKETIKTAKKWSVSPVFAVLNSNSFTNSSSLDANLSSSTKGENSYAYGLKVAYEINNKWTLQTGVQLQEMQYANNQIAVISSRSKMSNILFDNGNSVALENTSNTRFNASATSISSLVTFNGNLTQNFGYVEIPLEIKYNLLESKKFETQIVAGFSSLFLRKNEIVLENNNFINTGQATNLNNFNFSGNFGFDFNYNFTKNWSFYVNPMFKAQLNTFSKNANGFSPFNIGIYTGLNYQF